MPTKTAALIVFMRYPEPGRVKTRLARAIGRKEAADLYTRLARRTLGIVSDLIRTKKDVDALVFFTPSSKKESMEKEFKGPWRFIPQQGSHLGERMENAVSTALASGHAKVLMIGSDIADLQTSDLQTALEALETGCCVLNPAADGGFYLIGLNRPSPLLFKPESWGGPEVFERTKRLAEQSGLQVVSFEKRHDVDRPEDMATLKSTPLFQDRLSVIIPTRQSSERLAVLLRDLQLELWPGDEVVVACANHLPGREILSKGAVEVRATSSPPGRGLQLNAGARSARGNIYWFLHDDADLPNQCAYHVRKISFTQGASLGCFTLSFQPGNRSLDLIASWANFRTRVFGLPYGDQGLFCRSETFERIGGFQRPYLMEDIDFVRRVKKIGKLLIIDENIGTSPERYLRKGILRASLENHLFVLLFHLGVPDRSLYRLYYR